MITFNQPRFQLLIDQHLQGVCFNPLSIAVIQFDISDGGKKIYALVQIIIGDGLAINFCNNLKSRIRRLGQRTD